MADPREQVLAAAADLVDAFGRHDVAAYFACFAPDASFVFHTLAAPLSSRAAYQQEWASWERDAGFRVRSCASSEQAVRLLGDAAVFTHRVRTEVETGGVVEVLDERETIVFARGDGGWTAVHEHLSPTPA